MKEGKSTKLNNHQLQQHQNGHLSPFKFAKLLDPEASWDKDQLGDVLHWIRQIVALVCGLLWGAIPVVGGIWIAVNNSNCMFDLMGMQNTDIAPSTNTHMKIFFS
ncbi:uncharacterized protein LOC110640608 isoform X2 [Hevea brasiliensis]|uniref:uncharacterized protein LOC110640608 isoform X2 n=1 Tax=Hevea brasiliensis TaxID=3981 RepID=UPI0025E2AC44|nr:uncharacterized protein LOC110640608 isoform X2 [Hevea brasiliensis]